MSPHMAIHELDVSNVCRPNSITARINDVKISAAFFTFLRANLALPPSAMSSNVSTPVLEPQTMLPPPSPTQSPLAQHHPGGGGVNIPPSSPASFSSTSSSSSSIPTTSSSTNRPVAQTRHKRNNPNRRNINSNNNNVPQTAFVVVDDDDIPPLTLDVLTERAHRADALRLIADSIAQQRQRTALTLVLHPLCLAGLFLCLALAYQHAWVRRGRDLGLALIMGSGVVMSYLLAIQWVTAPYLRRAEALGWGFLARDGGAGGSDEEDMVIGMRFGDETVGALVLRLEPSPSSSSAGASGGGGSGGGGGGGGGGVGSSGGGGRKKNYHRGGHHQGGSSLSGGRGVIRAWTTTARYRRRGLGGDMLRAAVRITRERCGRDAEVGFAREHANSLTVLPEVFNGPHRKVEMKAARALEAVLAGWEGSRRKR